MTFRWLFLLFLSFSLSAGYLTGQPAPDDPVQLGFAVGGFLNEILIDGEIDPAWDLAPPHPLDNWLPLTTPLAASPSASWRALYDEGHLYLLVEVQDAHLVPWVDNKIGNADAVEIFLSGTYTRALAPSMWNGGAFGDKDYHLRFGIGPALGEEPHIETGLHSTLLWTPKPNSADATEVRYWVVPTEEGYRMEIRIDLALISDDVDTGFRSSPPAHDFDVNENNFSEFRKIGFEIQVTDTDPTSTERAGKLAWSNYVNNYPGDPASNTHSNAWVHTATWGTLVFVQSTESLAPSGWKPMTYYDSPVFHWIYYFDSGWAIWHANFEGPDWGLLYLDEIEDDHSGWVFHFDHGWIYFLPQSIKESLFAYGVDLGWITVSETFGAPYFYRYDTETFEPWTPPE